MALNQVAVLSRLQLYDGTVFGNLQQVLLSKPIVWDEMVDTILKAHNQQYVDFESVQSSRLYAVDAKGFPALLEPQELPFLEELSLRLIR